MASRAMFLLGLVLLGFPTPALSSNDNGDSNDSSDPSCATIQVAAASTPESDPNCPAVLISVTLTASTDGCASEIEMIIEIEEYPRDVETYGGESSAALEDKTITWTAPALTSGMALSVEFRLDLCGYCEKYDDRNFNPIDSFRYDDAEGNEPNDRMIGYQLKLDCNGIEGDPVESIVATPAPVLPATPSPSTTTSPVAATLAASEATVAPSLETLSPSDLAATLPPGATIAPAGTPSPGVTTAPGATWGPTASLASDTTIGPVPSVAPVSGSTNAPWAIEELTHAPALDDDGEFEDDFISDDNSSDSSEANMEPTDSPTAAPTDAMRGIIFTESPTAGPTASPTGSPTSRPSNIDADKEVDTSQGVTLKIQSIFEARRRALASDVWNNLLGRGRRGLSPVYEEDTDQFDEVMVGVCASMLGVERENVISVHTDFGPDGPADDAGRRMLMSTSSASEDGAMTATTLTPITTCEVDVSGTGESRAMTAATMVDRMLQPENLVLMLDENSFGPVNAVVTSISFWQNQCRDQTCPAGDGSYASVLPITETESQLSVEGEEMDANLDDAEQVLFGFVVIAAGLMLLALLSWCALCLCCGGLTKRTRKSKMTTEERYSVKSPPIARGGFSESSPQRRERSTSTTPAGADKYRSSGELPGPSPTSPSPSPTPPRPKSSGRGRNRTPPPKLSTSLSMTVGKDGAPTEPLSPGEAAWRHKFGLSPLRDYSFRGSAPVSPRRTPPKTLAGDPFCTTYKDHVVAAADGNLGGRLALPPLADDASTAMESQSTWQVRDEINANVQHNNDPVGLSSLGKAGAAIATALTSPRKELNRLKEALNRPSRVQACSSNSPTVTASSADPSSAPGFFGSDGGFSPHNNLSNSHFNTTSSPIYEIDIEAEGDGGAAAAREFSRADSGVPKGRNASERSTGGTCGSSRSTSSSSSSRASKTGRNMFAKTPGSPTNLRSTGGSSRGTPSSQSERSTYTDRSTSTERSETYREGEMISILATAAAVAEAKVGVQSPTGRAYRAFVRAGSSSSDGGGGSCGGSVVSDSSGRGVSGDEPPRMSPLSVNNGEASRRQEVVKAKSSGDEEGGSVSPSHRRPPSPFGGALSAFSCMSPQLSPDKSPRGFHGKTPLLSPSRLPEINDEDLDEQESREGAGKRAEACSLPLQRPPLQRGPNGGGSDLVGGETSAPASMSLERVLATSHARTITHNLMPIKELVDKEYFTDSETGSEISSRASSVSGAMSEYRVPRDPAALLAAAMAKAGQIAEIPPPSVGRHGEVSTPLSVVQENPTGAVPMPERIAEIPPPSVGSPGKKVERPVSAVQEVPIGVIPLPEQVVAIPPPFAGGSRKTVERPVSVTQETTPVEAIPLPGLISPESDDSFIGSDPSPPAAKSPLAPTIGVGTMATPIPSPAQRPARCESGENGAGQAPLPTSPSIARSRQESEGKGEERWAGEKNKGDKKTLGGDADAESFSTTPDGALEQASRPSSSCGASVQSSKTVEMDAAKPPPSFSLKGALAAFLGRKNTQVSAAPAVPAEDEHVRAVTISADVPENDSASLECTKSPESHTLTVWPDAMVEKPPRTPLGEGFVGVPVSNVDKAVGTITIDVPADSTPSECTKSPEVRTLGAWPDAIIEEPPRTSLDEGFVDVPLSEMAFANDADDEAVFELPARVRPADLPALVLSSEETNTEAKPGQTVFSRATMNLQSPEPDSPMVPKRIPMPALPKPPSPSMSGSLFRAKTPPSSSTSATAPSRMSDASPKYDRAAIVKAMSQAQSNKDEDDESDIVMPRAVWPSERRQNSTTSTSGFSDVTASSSGRDDHNTSRMF